MPEMFKNMPLSLQENQDLIMKSQLSTNNSAVQLPSWCKPLVLCSLVSLVTSSMALSAYSAPRKSNVQPSLSADLSSLPKDGETVFGDHKVLATLDLDNKGVLRFVKVGSAVGILEEAPKGSKSIKSVPGIEAKMPPIDVFYAFSKPGTKVPQDLLAGSPRISRSKPQGWARKLIAQSTSMTRISTGFCNDADFQAWFNTFGYNDRGTPVFRLNQVPRTSSFFELKNYTPGNGLIYKFYNYTVSGNEGSISNDVDRYVTRVAVCAIDNLEASNPQGKAHPSISYQGFNNSHMGPVARVMYRLPGQSVWKTAILKDFAASEVGSRIFWHFNSGLNWDWRTDIYWAGADDSFDIGHAVEDL
ncbi:MAG TPA: hypothetical protein V6D19_09180 [Stenomitos sp.]